VKKKQNIHTILILYLLPCYYQVIISLPHALSSQVPVIHNMDLFFHYLRERTGCCKALNGSKKRDKDDGEWMEPIHCASKNSSKPNRDGHREYYSIHDSIASKSKGSVVKWADLAQESISSVNIDTAGVIGDDIKQDEELYTAVNFANRNMKNSAGLNISMGSLFSEDSVSRQLGGFSHKKTFNHGKEKQYKYSKESRSFSDVTMDLSVTDEFSHEDGDSDAGISSDQNNSVSSKEISDMND